MERQRVDRTEVTLDTSEFFFEDQMVEARLEPADSGRDLHRLVITTELHLILGEIAAGFQVLERLTV